jgi:hypothetical protein
MNELASPDECSFINQRRMGTVLAMGQSANESIFAFYEEKHCRRLVSFLKAES